MIMCQQQLTCAKRDRSLQDPTGRDFHALTITDSKDVLGDEPPFIIRKQAQENFFPAMAKFLQ